MYLTEALNRYKREDNRQPISKPDYQVAHEALLAAIAACTDVNELRQVIHIESTMGLEFPVEISLAGYRRILEIIDAPSLLLEFAYYLAAVGPDWDDEAERMKQTALFLNPDAEVRLASRGV